MKIPFKQLLKDIFTVPCEGEREEVERGTFKLAGGSLYSYIRWNNGYSESIELFNEKNDYLGSFEALSEACLHCERIYGSPSPVRNQRSDSPARNVVQLPIGAIGGILPT